MLFKNNLGLSINLPKSLFKCDSKDPTLHSWCFGEDQGRIIVATDKIDEVESFLEDGNIDYFILGKTNSSNNLNLNDKTIISINDIKELNDQTLPSLMGE